MAENKAFISSLIESMDTYWYLNAWTLRRWSPSKSPPTLYEVTPCLLESE